MRWIAFLLVLLNIGYFLWAHYSGGTLFSIDDEVRPASDAAAQGPKSVPTLILLSEQLAASQAGLVAARERQAVASDVGSSEVALKREKVEPAKPILVCREVGPFVSKADAQSVMDVLQRQSVESVTLRDQKISEEKSYWLSLPQSGVAEPLAERIQKVEKVGLTTRRMDSGRLAGKVVAGPFISYEVAESYLFRLLAAGVDMAIEPIVDVQFQYWVLVEWMYEPGFVTPSSILEGFLAPLEQKNGNELQQNACS